MEAAKGASEARGHKAPSLCFVGASPIHARPQVRSEGPDPRRQQLPVKEDEEADRRSRSAALQPWSCTCCFLCLKNGASLRGRVNYKMLLCACTLPPPPLVASYQPRRVHWAGSISEKHSLNQPGRPREQGQAPFFWIDPPFSSLHSFNQLANRVLSKS